MNDPGVASISFTGTFSSSISAATPAVPSHADLDMRKVMLAAGGLNYKTVLRDTDIHIGPDSETVLRDTDIHIGPDSENFPSERRGGEARRANLKRKARYIMLSIAKTFVYCPLNTVSIEDAGDIFQTFANVNISFFYKFLLIVSCTLHAVYIIDV